MIFSSCASSLQVPAMKRFLQSCVIVFAVAAMSACGGGSSRDSNQSNGNSGGGDTGSGGAPLPSSNAPFWTQWGANPQHSGAVAVAGQGAGYQTADSFYDSCLGPDPGQ